MCQYIETIRVVDGCVCNLAYHEQRMNRTRKEMLGLTEPLHIADLLQAVSLPMECSKLRFVYDKEGIHDITCTPYICKEINSLRLVYDNNISYHYKSTDRSALNELKNSKVTVTKYLLFATTILQIHPILTLLSMMVNNGLHPLHHFFAVRCANDCSTVDCFKSVKSWSLTFLNISI